MLPLYLSPSATATLTATFPAAASLAAACPDRWAGACPSSTPGGAPCYGSAETSSCAACLGRAPDCGWCRYNLSATNRSDAGVGATCVHAGDSSAQRRHCSEPTAEDLLGAACQSGNSLISSPMQLVVMVAASLLFGCALSFGFMLWREHRRRLRISAIQRRLRTYRESAAAALVPDDDEAQLMAADGRTAALLAALEQLPDFMMELPANAGPEDAPTCAICMSEYDEDKRCTALPCGHTFHRACVHQWLSSGRAPNGECALCKAPLIVNGGAPAPWRTPPPPPPLALGPPPSSSPRPRPAPPCSTNPGRGLPP